MSEVILHHGDCLEFLRTLEAGSVDAVVTDPPYGVGLGIGKDMRASGHGLAKGSYCGFEDTYSNFVHSVVPRISASLSIAKRGAVFTGPHIHEQRKPDVIGGIYCSAGAGRHSWGFKTLLPVLFYGKAPDLHLGAKRPCTIASNARAEKNGHPCPKPLDWMIWLVELTTRPGETVFDPFMGSGTTGVACVRTGRNFIGCELDANYFEIAQRRIAAEREKLALFAETTP